MLEEGSVVKLGDNHNYDVIFSTMYNDQNYIFVSNQENVIDSCFYIYDNTKNLKLVKDEKIINYLLSIYKEKVSNEQ